MHDMNYANYDSEEILNKIEMGLCKKLCISDKKKLVPLYEYMEANGIYIAGSFIIQCITEQFYKDSDVDFFVTGYAKQNINEMPEWTDEFYKSFRNLIENNYELGCIDETNDIIYDKNYAMYQDLPGEFFNYGTFTFSDSALCESALCESDKKNKIKLQLLFVDIKLGNDNNKNKYMYDNFFDGFDFLNCGSRLFIAAGKPYITIMHYNETINNILLHNTRCRQIGQNVTMSRFIKYASRGWTIMPI